MKTDLEKHDRVMIRTLIISMLIILPTAVLYKQGKIMQPTMEECGKVIQRETSNVDLRGDTTRGVIQMTGGRKSFSLNGYAVDGDTICKENNTRVKKDTFISY